MLFLISKSAISASFLIIYPFAGELYPTQLRGVAIGFSAYISGLGLIIIPFVTYLVSLWPICITFYFGISKFIDCTFLLNLSGQGEFSFASGNIGSCFRDRRYFRSSIARDSASQATANRRGGWTLWERLDDSRLLPMRPAKVRRSLISQTQTWNLKFLQSVVSRPPSASASYEDLSLGETMEMHEVPSELPPLPQLPKRTLSDDQPRKGPPPVRAGSVRRLVRHSSVMDTQRDSDGSIKMTYWFWSCVTNITFRDFIHFLPIRMLFIKERLTLIDFG